MKILVGDHVLGLGGVGGHVRGGGVGFQCVGTLPLFDNYKRVGTELSLDSAHVGRVNRRTVLDAAPLRMDRWHVRAEFAQNGFTHSRFGSDDRYDMNYELVLPVGGLARQPGNDHGHFPSRSVQRHVRLPAISAGCLLLVAGGAASHVGRFLFGS